MQMRVFVRLISVLLVLTTSGAARASILAFEAVEACADEEAGAEDCCDDCTTACATCVQCPLQSVQLLMTRSPSTPVPVRSEVVLAHVDASPGTSSTADIFHPPRQ